MDGGDFSWKTEFTSSFTVFFSEWRNLPLVAPRTSLEDTYRRFLDSGAKAPSLEKTISPFCRSDQVFIAQARETRGVPVMLHPGTSTEDFSSERALVEMTIRWYCTFLAGAQLIAQISPAGVHALDECGFL